MQLIFHKICQIWLARIAGSLLSIESRKVIAQEFIWVHWNIAFAQLRYTTTPQPMSSLPHLCVSIMRGQRQQRCYTAPAPARQFWPLTLDNSIVSSVPSSLLKKWQDSVSRSATSSQVYSWLRRLPLRLKIPAVLLRTTNSSFRNITGSCRFSGVCRILFYGIPPTFPMIWYLNRLSRARSRLRTCGLGSPNLTMLSDLQLEKGCIMELHEKYSGPCHRRRFQSYGTHSEISYQPCNLQQQLSWFPLKMVRANSQNVRISRVY